MSLLILLSTSSFSLKDYLTQVYRYLDNSEYTKTMGSKTISSKEMRSELLTLGVSIKIPSALELARDQESLGSTNWLNYTKTLAVTSEVHAIELASYYKDKNDIISAKLWLKPHLSNQSTDVVRAYASLLNQSGEKLNQFLLLSQQPELRFEQQTILLALELGKISFINELISSVEATNELSYLPSLLSDIHYDKLPRWDNKKNDTLPPAAAGRAIEGCPSTVTFYATTYQDIIDVRHKLRGLNEHPIIRAVCPVEVRYFPISKLQCELKNEQPIICNEQVIVELQETTPTDYIALMLPKGGANVHYGVLYFDRSDTTDVLIHELAHFAGFIDEYPVRAGHSICKKEKQAVGLNVVVFDESITHVSREQLLAKLPWRKFIKKDTPLWHIVKGEKVLGTPLSYENEVGLFLGETCLNNASYAYKPLHKSTFMRYFELPIPNLYQALLEESSQFFRPSYSKNIELLSQE